MSRTHWVVTTGWVLWGSSVSLASAATFNVNTLVDAVDSNAADGICLTAAGECSLRAAIQQANASAGADVIELINGLYELSLTGDDEDAANTGDLDVSSEITINGAGASLVQIDGQRADRVFQVHSGGNLSLNGLAVHNGSVDFDSGGGIDVNEGRLTVNDCTISLNYAMSSGGGINNFRGTVVLNRSVVSNNVVNSSGAGITNTDGDFSINYSVIRDNEVPFGLGGGIYNSAWGRMLEIQNSSISGHSGMVDGGGIYHLLGSLKIVNSTISNNLASRDGGGLFYSNGNSLSGGSGELVNVTIAANTAQSVTSGGSGVYVRGGVPLQIANSIIADNSVGANCYVDGQIVSLGNNLDTDGSCGLSTDVSSISNGQAALDVLADNGGGSLTHALLASSDALDAADDGQCPAVDQRGYERPGSGCDIGAYEAGAAGPFVAMSSAFTASALLVEPVNSQPTVLDMFVAANAGGSVSAVLSGVDAEADPLTYEIIQQPFFGRVGWDDNSAGAFTYVASPDAIGTDSFTFRACDSLICSRLARVNIVITNETVMGEISIELAEGSQGVSGPVSVVSSDSDLGIHYSDVDYSHPLGIFIFDVDDIPSSPDSQLNGTVVVIQLPENTVIDPAAEIRKMDVNAVWQTLGSDPDPLRSSGVIDPVAKTLTLTLRENDEFDLNLAMGVISDPVAIAVKKELAATHAQSIGSASVSAAETTTGGGAAHTLLVLVLLRLIWRRLS